ncbi:hypothetical protein PSAB6_410074 [Paraburkholderia sabiae]|nr:hypothetical protein PSAB6_410074 [Paraburkholderia sabiae]
MLRYMRRLAFSLTWLTQVRRFIVVHMSCGQVRGQCVEFSKKAKRNNGVCVLRDLRAAVFGLPDLLSAVFRRARLRTIRWNDRGKQVRGYFTDFDARGNLDEGCRAIEGESVASGTVTSIFGIFVPTSYLFGVSR